MNTLLGIALGAALWFAARRLFSEGAANVALALFAFTPVADRALFRRHHRRHRHALYLSRRVPTHPLAAQPKLDANRPPGTRARRTAAGQVLCASAGIPRIGADADAETRRASPAARRNGTGSRRSRRSLSRWSRFGRDTFSTSRISPSATARSSRPSPIAA